MHLAEPSLRILPLQHSPPRGRDIARRPSQPASQGSTLRVTDYVKRARAAALIVTATVPLTGLEFGDEVLAQYNLTWVPASQVGMLAGYVTYVYHLLCLFSFHYCELCVRFLS